MARKLLSVVVPAYNEESCVRLLHAAVVAALEPLAADYDFELLFVDDHSTDTTFALLGELAASDPRVRVLRFARNYGHQRAVHTGCIHARGDAAILMDCDLQDPPELLPEFVRLWEQGHQVVYGVRRSRAESRAMEWSRRLAYRLIDLLSEDRLPHDAGDFRLLDRCILDQLKQLDDAQPYVRGASSTMGFQQIGVEYDRGGRAAGTSHYSWRALIQLGLDGILGHSVVPLRFATYTGLAVALLACLTGLGYLFAKLCWGRNWPSGFATLTLLMLISISLNAVFLGIIGEYLGRIYRQVHRRPVGLIEAQLGGAEPRP